VLPGTVGPEEGNGAAVVKATVAAKKPAAASEILRRRGCTKRSESVLAMPHCGLIKAKNELTEQTFLYKNNIRYKRNN
jgi:hypothetical protein